MVSVPRDISQLQSFVVPFLVESHTSYVFSLSPSGCFTLVVPVSVAVSPSRDNSKGDLRSLLRRGLNMSNQNKKPRLSPPQTPNTGIEMDVAESPTEKKSAAGSDASSDWDDWADAMVAQGERPREAAAADEARGCSPTDGSNDRDPDDEWVRTMMEQPSVVLGADNRVWDYVLQMVVEEEEQQGSGAATMASPVQEVMGAAATEYVSRWLGRHLPLTIPLMKFPALQSPSEGRENLTRGCGGDDHRRRRPLLPIGKAVVDSVAEPSAVAVVSRSPEQGMHRVSLFSLGANAGAALAAAVVQPGAAGLQSASVGGAFREHSGTEFYDGTHGNDDLSDDRPQGAGRGNRGVVFESLDSRILEGALVSAMGRLGLGVKYRSRSGMWRLRPGTVLPVAHASMPTGTATPLTLEDAAFIVRHSRSLWPGEAPVDEGIVGSEALVRGLIRRNPSAGIRKRGQLVAWSLSFDNGLAGALHVAASPGGGRLLTLPSTLQGGEPEEEGFSTRNVTLALLASLLSQRPEATTPTVSGIASVSSDGACAETGGGELRQHSSVGFDTAEERLRYFVSSAEGDSNRGSGVAAFVIDDGSPLVTLLEELGLERVCDADWVRFEPVDGYTSVNPPMPSVQADDEGLVGDVSPVLPLIDLVLHP